MTVLVTGGAGYVGSHTVRLLRHAGRDVVVLDNLSSGNAAAVLGAPLVTADIADSAVVERTVRDFGVDSAIHFAAFKSVAESMRDPGSYFDNNIASASRLFDTLAKSGVRRVVFSSSAAVYGQPTALPVAEDHRLDPDSAYGETKLVCERLLRWFDACHDLRSVSLRYFNAAGASTDGQIGEDWTDARNLVPLAMKAALGQSAPLKVFGTDYPTPDGTAIRDYVHVLDLADAHLRALEYLEGGGATTAVNLGTGTGSSVREVLDTMHAVTGVAVPVEYVGRRAGDPAGVYANNSRARDLLGWTPQSSLHDIVASAWNWHSKHQGATHD